MKHSCSAQTEARHDSLWGPIDISNSARAQKPFENRHRNDGTANKHDGEMRRDEIAAANKGMNTRNKRYKNQKTVCYLI